MFEDSGCLQEVLVLFYFISEDFLCVSSKDREIVRTETHRSYFCLHLGLLPVYQQLRGFKCGIKFG